MGVAVEIPDAVDERASRGQEFALLEEPVDPAVMVARGDGDRDEFPKRLEYARKFAVLLPGCHRDVVLEIAEEEQEIGSGLLDAGDHTFGTGVAPARDMNSAAFETGLDSHVEVGDDQDALLLLDQEGGAVLNEM